MKNVSSFANYRFVAVWRHIFFIELVTKVVEFSRDFVIVLQVFSFLISVTISAFG
jgi:hypothetical protein